MPGTYSTDTLIGVVQGLKTPSSFLIDRYFRSTTQDESEEIHFDLVDQKRRIAPFVSPVVEGSIVEGLGHTTKSFRPAYVKDKRVFDPNQPFKRAIGEQIGGSFTPEERRDAYLATQLQDQLQMLGRRLELMACEVLRTAKETIKGEKYPTTVVDFQRAAALSPVALAGTARWGQSAAQPLKNLKSYAKLVRKESGVNPLDVIMGEDAAAEFLESPAVQDRLDNRNVQGASLSIGVQHTEGATFHGTIDGFNIFSYGGYYVDPEDETQTEQEMWPVGDIVMTSPLLEGVRAFGAIRDGKAGFRAVPYFPKMWEKEDPAVEYLMLQSAPLLVPTRVNASFKIQVLG